MQKMQAKTITELIRFAQTAGLFPPALISSQLLKNKTFPHRYSKTYDYTQVQLILLLPLI